MPSIYIYFKFIGILPAPETQMQTETLGVNRPLGSYQQTNEIQSLRYGLGFVYITEKEKMKTTSLSHGFTENLI